MQRRKPQGRRKSSPLRWLGWLAGLLVIGGVLLTLFAPTLATRLIRSYLLRQEFRQNAEAMLSTVTGGEAHIHSLTWNDDNLSISEFQLEGTRGWNVAASDLHAALDFGAIRNGVWSIQNVGAEELTLRPSSIAATENQEFPTSSPEDPPSSANSIPSFFRSYIPTKVEISGCDVERFSLEKDGWQITGARLSSGVWKSGRTALPFKLSGGTLQIPIQLPEQAEPLRLTIDKATLRASEGKVQLSDASLRWKESSAATLRGSVRFDSGAWQTFAHISAVPVGEFLNAWWKQRLTGQLKGDLDFSGRRNATPAWKADAVLENGVLQGLPLLDTLAAHTRVERFKRLVLDICQASVRPQGEVLRIENIIAQSNGLLRLEGFLAVQGRALSGEFMVGVTPETLRWIPGAQSRVFIEPNPKGPPGLLWTRVQVAGTLDAPLEDLSNRLIGGAGMALLFDTPAQLVGQGAEALLKPVLGEDAAKVPGKLMEEAGGIIENGVKTGSGLLNGILPMLPGRQ